jgi:hypothetical protein
MDVVVITIIDNLESNMQLKIGIVLLQKLLEAILN